MPEDRPTASELLETVAEYLTSSVRPRLEGHAAFEALIAANLLRIAGRELELGPSARAQEGERLRHLLGSEGAPEDLEPKLVAMIREGRFEGRRDEVLEHLRRSAADRLRIANPDYLEGG